MPPAPVKKIEFPLTKFVEAIKDQTITTIPEPTGPGYEVLFDLPITVDGWKEIRVWVHVMNDNYETTPVTAAAQLELRFLHGFTHGSFDYEKAVIPWNGFTSYINGYTIKPVIGKSLRVMCHPANLPTPFRLSVTYLLVR